MPLEITKLKEGLELSPRHLARGLRIPDDVRVNRVYYYDQSDPKVACEIFANRLHNDSVVMPSVDASPSKVLLLGGKAQDHQVEVLMASTVPHTFLDEDSPYHLEARATMMNEDMQILSLDEKSIEKLFAPPLDWTPPEVSSMKEHGGHDKPTDRTTESVRKRKGVLKLSNDKVQAVKHSRAAFQRLAVARGSDECMNYAEQHCKHLDEDSLISSVELILEELRGRDNPNHMAPSTTPKARATATAAAAARHSHEREEEKIDLRERLDRLANSRKREILSHLERRDRMKQLRSASLQHTTMRRGSSLRHKSLSNVTGATQPPFSPSAPPFPSPSSSVSSSSPPRRRGSRLFSPVKLGGSGVSGEETRTSLGIEEDDEEDKEDDEEEARRCSHDNGSQDEGEGDEEEGVESVLRRYYSQEEPVPTIRYYSAGSAVVSEEGEVILDGPCPEVSRVERDRRVMETALHERMMRRGEELGLYDPQFTGEQPEMQAARKSSRGAVRTRQQVEAEVAVLNKQKNDQRTRNVLAAARMRQLQARVSTGRDYLQSEARRQVEDHRYHLPAKLDSWLEETTEMLAVGADADVVPQERLGELMMWWTDDGEGDEGRYGEYLSQHEQVRRQSLRARVNHGLLGSRAATHAEAKTFITQGTGTGRGGMAGAADFIGRANVRETIRLGKGSGAAGAGGTGMRTTNQTGANLVSRRRKAGPSNTGSASSEGKGGGKSSRDNAATAVAPRKGKGGGKLSDAKALLALEAQRWRAGLTRVQREAWLVALLTDMKGHVDERRKLADLQRQSRTGGQGKGREEEEGADISAGLLRFCLSLAQAVQLGLSLTPTSAGTPTDAGAGRGQEAAEESHLLLTLFARCFSAEDLRHEAVYPIVMHAMRAVGITAPTLLAHIRSTWGEDVEVALK